MSNRIKAIAQLMRIHQPVGFLLLLWPALWGIFLASAGMPSAKIILIFCAGTLIMRSAGDVVNDLMDRNIDAHVHRTQERPLASKKISVKAAIMLLVLLLIAAFFLSLQLNLLSVIVAALGCALTFIYPLLKRVSYFPQVLLGFIFSGVPMLMGFTAIQNEVSAIAVWACVTASVWPIAYDTIYAMQDYVDDRKIGVKSLAVYLNGRIIPFVICLELIFFTSFLGLAVVQNFKTWFWLGFLAAVMAFVWQLHILLRQSTAADCYQRAFKITHWQGAALFLGLLLEKICISISTWCCYSF